MSKSGPFTTNLWADLLKQFHVVFFCELNYCTPPPSHHPLAVYCVSSNVGPARVLAARPCEKRGIAIPCQCRQAKEMPPTEGESGPIGRHPLVCNSLSVFGTTRAWLNQVFEAWRRPSLLSCQSTEGIPPQGMRKNRLSLIWPFPLGW